MDTSTDHYKILGVNPEDDRTTIKAAWSGLVQELHPDMGGDPKAFMEVQKAFEILGDEDKRRQYDAARTGGGTVDGNPHTVEYGTESASKPSAPNSGPKREAWVPPHMRNNGAATPPPDTTASPRTGPQPTQTPSRPDPRSKPSWPSNGGSSRWANKADKPDPARGAAPESKPASVEENKPRPLGSWRYSLVDNPQLKVNKNAFQLWLPPSILAGISIITGFGAIGHADADFLGGLGLALWLICFAMGAIGTVIDWVRFQGFRESMLGTAIGACFAIVMGVAGFFGDSFALTASGAALFASVMWMSYSLRYKYVLTRLAPVKDLKKFIAFGKPGKHAVDTTQKIVEAGMAEVLNDLFKIKALRVFHGLVVPAHKLDIKQGNSVQSTGVDVVPGSHLDHAITAGQKVALVDSVMWPPGKYSMDNYGNVLLNGQHSHFDLEPYEEDFKRFRANLPSNVKVRMFVTVHSDGPVEFEAQNAEIELVHVSKLVDTIGSWMVEDQDKLDCLVNATVAKHLAR